MNLSAARSRSRSLNTKTTENKNTTKISETTDIIAKKRTSKVNFDLSGLKSEQLNKRASHLGSNLKTSQFAPRGSQLLVRNENSNNVHGSRSSVLFKGRGSQIINTPESKTPRPGISAFGKQSDMRRRSTMHFDNFEKVFDKNKIGKVSSSSSSSSSSVSSKSLSSSVSQNSSFSGSDHSCERKNSEDVKQSKSSLKLTKRASQINLKELASKRKSQLIVNTDSKLSSIRKASQIGLNKKENELEESPTSIQLTREKSNELRSSLEDKQNWDISPLDKKSEGSNTTDIKDSETNLTFKSPTNSFRSLTSSFGKAKDFEEYRRFDSRVIKVRLAICSMKLTIL